MHDYILKLANKYVQLSKIHSIYLDKNSVNLIKNALEENFGNPLFNKPIKKIFFLDILNTILQSINPNLSVDCEKLPDPIPSIFKLKLGIGYGELISELPTLTSKLAPIANYQLEVKVLNDTPEEMVVTVTLIEKK